MIITLNNNTPRIHPTAFIAPGAVIIGDAEIGPLVNIWYGAIIRADMNPVSIGEGCNIQDGTIIHIDSVPGGTTLGKWVTVGHGALLHHCQVEDYAFIGMRALVMDGAVIGCNSLVAAGSLVSPGTKVPPGVMVMGSPAKVKRDLTPEELKHYANHARHYAEMAQGYINQGLGQPHPQGLPTSPPK